MPTKQTTVDQLARKAAGVQLTGDYAKDYDREPRLQALLTAMGRSKQWFVCMAQSAEARGRSPMLSILSVAIDGGIEGKMEARRQARLKDRQADLQQFRKDLRRARGK